MFSTKDLSQGVSSGKTGVGIEFLSKKSTVGEMGRIEYWVFVFNGKGKCLLVVYFAMIMLSAFFFPSKIRAIPRNMLGIMKNDTSIKSSVRENM